MPLVSYPYPFRLEVGGCRKAALKAWRRRGRRRRRRSRDEKREEVSRIGGIRRLWNELLLSILFECKQAMQRLLISNNHVPANRRRSNKSFTIQIICWERKKDKECSFSILCYPITVSHASLHLKKAMSSSYSCICRFSCSWRWMRWWLNGREGGGASACSCCQQARTIKTSAVLNICRNSNVLIFCYEHEAIPCKASSFFLSFFLFLFSLPRILDWLVIAIDLSLTHIINREDLLRPT